MGSFNNSYQMLCTKRDLSGWIKNPVIWNSAGKADKMKAKVLIGFFIMDTLLISMVAIERWDAICEINKKWRNKT